MTTLFNEPFCEPSFISDDYNLSNYLSDSDTELDSTFYYQTEIIETKNFDQDKNKLLYHTVWLYSWCECVWFMCMNFVMCMNYNMIKI